MKTTRFTVRFVEEALLVWMEKLGFKHTNKRKPTLCKGGRQRRGEIERWWFDYKGKRGDENVVIDSGTSLFKVNNATKYWRVRFQVWHSRPSPTKKNKIVYNSKLMSWRKFNDLDKAVREVSVYITKKSVPEKKPWYGPYPKLNYVYRKFEGDDCYSWAVFRRGSGCPICTGMSLMDAKGMAQDEHNRSLKEKTT